jgi:glutamate formiminotransferase
MSTIVECVPNFSEGRDKSKVDAIVAAMTIDGVYLLDREMDADHNRCVITLVGEREPIQEAAIRGVGKAAELIDLNQHQGAHPRMGAADVVPFIPIDGVTIEDCVAMARHVGEQIWKRYQVPVYLYEAAASTPERQNLENIRRGQFEGIRADIATNPARKPDYGDLKVHPSAGATVVGARKFLIAYNVFLNTSDVDIAKKIAKVVRFSSGGMRFGPSVCVRSEIRECVASPGAKSLAPLTPRSPLCGATLHAFTSANGVVNRRSRSDGVVLKARVTESGDDRATVEATLEAGGRVTATSRATFVAVKEGHPAFGRW